MKGLKKTRGRQGQEEEYDYRVCIVGNSEAIEPRCSSNHLNVKPLSCHPSPSQKTFSVMFSSLEFAPGSLGDLKMGQLLVKCK